MSSLYARAFAYELHRRGAGVSKARPSTTAARDQRPLHIMYSKTVRFGVPASWRKHGACVFRRVPSRRLDLKLLKGLRANHDDNNMNTNAILILLNCITLMNEIIVITIIIIIRGTRCSNGSWTRISPSLPWGRSHWAHPSPKYTVL